MAFNGSGVYNRLYNWVTDAASNIKIRADRMDAEMDGMATGLSTCVTKDGQTTITANIPMASHKFTGLAAGTARTDSVSLGQAQDSGFLTGTVGGTGDAITLTLSPAITAYAAGQKYSFVATATNTTAVTLAINGIASAKAVTKQGSNALVAGDITSGDVVEVQYDGTRFQVLSPLRTPVLTVGGVAFASLTGAASLVTNTFTGAQIGTVTALTSTSNSMAINLATNNNFSHTFTENTTLANPSNPVAGQSGRIFFTQHASSPKTLAFGNQYKFPGGSVPTVTASNSAIDVLYYDVLSSTQIALSLVKGLA